MVYPNQFVAFQDTHTRHNDSRLRLDLDSQDCRNVQVSERGDESELVWSFERKLDTCDEDDYVIEVRPLSPRVLVLVM